MVAQPAPLIGVPADRRIVDPHPMHLVGDKYLDAVVAAGGVPVAIPAMSDRFPVEAWLDRLDGLLIPGSPSNVERHHYGQPPAPADEWQDPERDALTLPLIREAVRRGMPFLGICRGAQELNVALGGTLYPRVHEVPGRHDHRADKTQPLAVQYAPAHTVSLAPGGVLAGLFGAPEVTVNSIHEQGIDRVADGLTVEAVAPDGQVEAVRVTDAETFQIAVQWHPEWQWRETPSYRALLEAFGEAVRRRRATGAT